MKLTRRDATDCEIKRDGSEMSAPVKYRMLNDGFKEAISFEVVDVEVD